MRVEAEQYLYESILNVYYKLVINTAGDLRHYGFRGVREVSLHGGKAWRYVPEWRRGGYELELWDKSRSVMRSEDPTRPPLGFFNYTFLLRYYPHPDERVFEEYSVKEQLIRLSSCFSEGDVFPSEACSLEVSRELFTIGILNLSVNEDVGVVRLSLASQDRFTSTLTEPFMVGNTLLKNTGEVDRNVPGWQLSWEFFERFLKLYMSKLGKPWLVVAMAEPGKIWKCGSKSCLEEATESILLKTVEAVFMATLEPEVTSLLEENLAKSIAEKAKHVSRTDDTIELPYIRVLLKNGRLLQQEESLFKEVLNIIQ